MTTLKRFSLPMLLFLLISCAPVEETGKNHKEVVLIENSGFFRGYKLGWAADTLLVNEKWVPVISNDSMIYYHEEVIFWEDTVLLDAYLAFDTYGLFEIQVDVFTKDDSLAETILETWSAILSSPFGKPEDLPASRRWTTFSESNNTVEVTLSQERNDENQKFISLNYLEPLDDEF